MKDFPGKLFLPVDGCDKAQASFTVKASILTYLFFIKDEEKKTNPLKQH